MKRSIFIALLLLISATGITQQRILMPLGFINSDKQNLLLTQNNDFAFLSYPTFSLYHDEGLSFNYATMTLTLRETREPTPSEYNLSSEYPWNNQYELKINKTQADALYSLFTSAVCASSNLGDDFGVMDGTYYEFHAHPYGGHTRSPGSKSNCGRLVNIVKKVCQCVKEQDTTTLDILFEEMETLTDIFVSLYPVEIPKHFELKYRHKRNKVKGKSMGLNF